MTREEKAAFIKELIGNVQAEVLSKVDQMPEEWDGLELRRYIADKFHACTAWLPKRRVRAYNNTMSITTL